MKETLDITHVITFYRLTPKRGEAKVPLYETVVVRSMLDDENLRTVSFIVKLLKRSGAKDVAVERRTEEVVKDYRQVSLAGIHERARKEIKDWKSIAK